MPFAEIIGVVLDGDAPSAPAGIPTCCRHTAFVGAPAGIFLSSNHCSANLTRFYFFVAGDVDFYVWGCRVITALWTYGAPGFNLQSGGGGVAEINKSGQRVAWPPGSSGGKGPTAESLVHVHGVFDAQVVPAALRKHGECTEDAQKIALARLACGGVCFTCSGQQESQAASLSPILYMYQR